MKKITAILIIMIGGFLASSLEVKAQAEWDTFSSAKVGYQSSYNGAVPFVDLSEGIWMVHIGKQLQKGVYVLLDEDGRNTGNTITLRRSGLTGRWGWLSPKDSESKKRDKSRKASFHSGTYELMLQIE